MPARRRRGGGRLSSRAAAPKENPRTSKRRPPSREDKVSGSLLDRAPGMSTSLGGFILCRHHRSACAGSRREGAGMAKMLS